MGDAWWRIQNIEASYDIVWSITTHKEAGSWSVFFSYYNSTAAIDLKYSMWNKT
jgi:hypothetical protein